MNGLTQTVIVDRGARVLRFGALIAVALMLPLAFPPPAGARRPHALRGALREADRTSN
jgi:hypothetical protein